MVAVAVVALAVLVRLGRRGRCGRHDNPGVSSSPLRATGFSLSSTRRVTEWKKIAEARWRLKLEEPTKTGAVTSKEKSTPENLVQYSPVLLLCRLQLYLGFFLTPASTAQGVRLLALGFDFRIHNPKYQTLNPKP